MVEETNEYIVVDKPAPLLVHPTNPGNPPTLLDGLQGLLAYDIANGARLSIINRLDRETSGLVLVTKTKEAARNFGLAMQRRQIQKTYEALCWGWPANDFFENKTPLLRKGEIQNSPIWLKRMGHAEGDPSHTKFRTLQRFQNNSVKFSLIQAEPITGRMHQIRVHLSELGLPIVGDKIYGPDENCYLEFIETGWTSALAEQLILPRQALHSCAMRVEGERKSCDWSCGLPSDISNFIQQASL